MIGPYHADDCAKCGEPRAKCCHCGKWCCVNFDCTNYLHDCKD